jgi:hypothetical protein
VAFEDFTAGCGQSAAVLLKALLDRHVIVEAFATKARSIMRAGALLLACAGVLLSQGG